MYQRNTIQFMWLFKFADELFGGRSFVLITRKCMEKRKKKRCVSTTFDPKALNIDQNNRLPLVAMEWRKADLFKRVITYDLRSY